MSKNIISYKQKMVLKPDDKMMSEVLSDENLMLIITALRKGPMTVDELVKEFEKQNIQKSDKSVYRYLKELIDKKLVARAGKRITSLNEENLQSETIYIRTAKMFLAGGLESKKSKLGADKTAKLFELIYTILNKKYPDQITSIDGVVKLLTSFDSSKDELVTKLFENADADFFTLESELDWSLSQYLIEYVGWLALILEVDVEKEIKECCP
ncbi:MAG TPA: winged helix-turn-helix domain-containing protein [candidate division Zixibacteria bacterium]|nr:winged helix-turn-helix domain-containing protein [candidate division Zixibacteria bacterium]